MRCGLEIERPAVSAGLVHMLQLASKTGATLAGKVFLIPRNRLHTSPTSPRVILIIFLLFPNRFILRSGEIRIGFQRFNICCQGAPCKRRAQSCLSPILHPLVVPV